MRGALVRLHRWIGLATAGFLFVAGLTGAVLAFQYELDALLNPRLFTGPVAGPRLSPSGLVTAVERAIPEARVTSVFFATAPGTTARTGVTSRAGGTALDFNQVFVEPVSGDVLGTRRFGACCFERENLVPFIWQVHHNLYLPRPWGTWLMGAVAIAWVFDCFVGLYLTLPRHRGRGTFWARWKPAWAIKRGAGAYRRNYDLHRAGGLWFWVLLLPLAISSVALNLPQEVAQPVMAALSPLSPPPFEGRGPAPTPAEARLAFDRTFEIAQEEAARRGWREPPRSMYHFARYRLFGVRFHEVGGPTPGQRWLYLDDAAGAILAARGGTEGTAGDVALAVQLPLHGGTIAGLPGRILIAVAGLAVALLSVTGIVIWWRKRAARSGSAAKPSSPTPRTGPHRLRPGG